MQITHKKNTAYYLAFPMVDTTSPESFKSGETVLDTGYYKDGAGAWTSLPIVDTVVEISSTGVYEVTLSAAEMNHDQVIIKMVSTNGADTAFLFDLRDEVDLGVAGAGLTAVPWNASWDAEVESECNDALVAQKLDHLVAVADADDPVDNSIVAKIANAAGDWSSFTPATDALSSLYVVTDGTATDAALALVDTTAIKAVTDQMAFTVANQLDANALSTGTDSIDAAAISTGGANAIADALLARQITESYATDGSQPTVAQMQYMLWSALAQFAISGTTMSCKKLDGTTQSMTFLLDSDTSPTSRTRNA